MRTSNKHIEKEGKIKEMSINHISQEFFRNIKDLFDCENKNFIQQKLFNQKQKMNKNVEKMQKKTTEKIKQVQNQLTQTKQNIWNSTKLDEIVKNEYVNIINELSMSLVKIETESMQIQKNKQIDDQFKLLQDNISLINNAIDELQRQGYCGTKKPKKNILKLITKLQLQNQYIWAILPELKPILNEIEKPVSTPFDNEQYCQVINDLVTKYFDSEPKIIERQIEVEVEKQVIVEKDRPVTKIVYKDLNKSEVQLAHELLYGIGRPKEVEKATQIYKIEAKKNDQDACMALGQIYREGIFLEKDIKKAFKLYQQASKLNNAHAKYQLGNLYISEEYYEENKSRKESLLAGYKLIQEAAQKNDLDAMTDMGYFYEHGLPKNEISIQNIIIKKNVEQAEIWYKNAARQNFPRALNNLGNVYIEKYKQIKIDNQKEEFEGKTIQKAKECFEKAIALGEVNALVNMGISHQQGNFGEPNDDEASWYFKKASDKGNSLGKSYYVNHQLENTSSNDHDKYLDSENTLRQILFVQPNDDLANFNLGSLYRYGLGVTKNPILAKRYFEKAAKLRNPKAMTALGDMHYSGFGVNINKDEALKWYSLAKELNDTQAMITLAKIAVNQGNYKEGQDLFKKAQELGNSEALTNLGIMYENGYIDNFPQKQQAIKLYNQAAKNGNSEAQEKLSNFGLDLNEIGHRFDDLIDSKQTTQDELNESQISTCGSTKTPVIENHYILRNKGYYEQENNSSKQIYRMI